MANAGNPFYDKDFMMKWNEHIHTLSMDDLNTQLVAKGLLIKPAWQAKLQALRSAGKLNEHNDQIMQWIRPGGLPNFDKFQAALVEMGETIFAAACLEYIPGGAVQSGGVAPSGTTALSGGVACGGVVHSGGATSTPPPPTAPSNGKPRDPVMSSKYATINEKEALVSKLELKLEDCETREVARAVVRRYEEPDEVDDAPTIMKKFGEKRRGKFPGTTDYVFNLHVILDYAMEKSGGDITRQDVYELLAGAKAGAKDKFEKLLRNAK